MMTRLPRLFRTLSLVPNKNNIAADIIVFWDILGDYPFTCILIMVYCVYSLESPRRGDSYENTQHAFMLKKIEKISLRP